MSGDRNIRWGVIVGPSDDKGPYKLHAIETDGKTMDAMALDLYGVQGNAITGGQCLILVPDGDEGKAVFIPLPPPAKRVDGQKEGEVSYKNHVTGNVIQHDANGHTTVETAADMKETIGADQTTTVAGTTKINTGGLLLLNC